MNRLFLIALALSLFLSGCIPGLSPMAAGDAQATSLALAGTLAAQTMIALPSPTILPTNTLTATVPPTATLAPTRTPRNTATPTTVTTTTAGTSSAQAETSTVTVTGTLPSPIASVTSTPTFGFGTATPTDLMIPREYGTQPPLVEYGRIRLINQSKTQVYISFQCTTPDNLYVVVEYPVGGTITVSVPAGKCHYVAWVGGRQFIGDIRIGRFEEFTFKFRKDRIIIQ